MMELMDLTEDCSDSIGDGSADINGLDVIK